jgi:hypothetical protein
MAADSHVHPVSTPTVTLRRRLILILTYHTVRAMLHINFCDTEPAQLDPFEKPRNYPSSPLEFQTVEVPVTVDSA